MNNKGAVGWFGNESLMHWKREWELWMWGIGW